MCSSDLVTVAGKVCTAAATGEAQLGVAVHNSGITGQVAALLFLESNTGNIAQAHCPTVDEDKASVGEFLGSLIQIGRASCRERV